MFSDNFRRLTAGLAMLALAAFIGAGCGDDNNDSGTKDTKTDASMTKTDDAMESTKTASVISAPGVDLRVTLDRLLAEHAALAYVALTKTTAGEADAEATVGALTANTDELSEAIGSVYGDDAADAFKTQWTAHIGMFVEYATGVATKDKAMQAKAKQDLTGYQVSFAKFLNTASGLDAKAAEAALGMHVTQLTTAVDQFAAKDYVKSYATAHEAYVHMFGTGDALAAAITKQKPDDFGYGDVTTAAADTRVALNRQLAEHASLAALATTKSLAGAKDATAVVGQLDLNSVELSKTIGSVYGADAEEAFLAQWRAHIGMFVAYTTALASDDDAGKQKAADDLAGYTTSFAKFLATATDGDEAAYQKALEMHVSQLAGALDAAKAGDAAKAWELEREAFAHMFGTGDAIVTAIVTQNPDKFGGTSGGGETPAADDSMDTMDK